MRISTKAENPIVSVIMPVFNGEKYLKESVSSILNQTFDNFEFLIINDGSTDNSLDIIKSFNDDRIILINNETNLKIVTSLNKGLSRAKGKYIARMDCDDISLPRRLEKQVAFLENNEDIGICGSWISLIGEKENEIWQSPINPDEIKCRLLFHSTLFHPSVILRKQLLSISGLKYDKKFLYAQDYNLWVEASRITKISNIQEVLLLYRIHKQKISSKYRDIQRFNDSIIRREQLQYLFDEINNENMDIHNAIGNWEIKCSKFFVEKSENWFKDIINANTEKKIYDEQKLFKLLFSKWLLIIKKSTKLGLWTWKKFINSQLTKKSKNDFKINLKILIKCFLKK